MKKNYTPISADDAKASWVAEFEAGDDHCLHKASDKCPGANCDFGKRTQRCNCLATNSLLHTICKATKAKKRLGKSVRLDVVRLIETADKDAGGPAPPSRVVIKLPRYDYDEIIDALEGEEDDAADASRFDASAFLRLAVVVSLPQVYGLLRDRGCENKAC